MIRAVLDANVLVSGFPAVAGPMAELINRWRAGRFSLVISLHILDEIARAWSKPYWRARFSTAQVTRALALLREEADVTPITVQVTRTATHPEDDVVLAAAVSARVDYLVTGDKGLQGLGHCQGIAILSPRAFLDLLDQEEGNDSR